MVEARQLSATDASILNQQIRSGIQKPVATEEDVLHWLAKEYDLGYTSLDDMEPDRELLFAVSRACSPQGGIASR